MLSTDHSEQQLLLDQLLPILHADSRVDGCWISGSLAAGTHGSLSDIDLWLLFQEESALQSFMKDLSLVFSYVLPLEHLQQATAYHWFLLFSNGIQIDLNLISAASYCSIKQQTAEMVLMDKTLLLAPTPSRHTLQGDAHLRDRLCVGYMTLARALSKYQKQNFIVTQRFVEGLRTNVLIPLLPYLDSTPAMNRVSLSLESLSPPIRSLFEQTYPTPHAQSCHRALEACWTLLTQTSFITHIQPPEALTRQVKNLIEHLT